MKTLWNAAERIFVYIADRIFYGMEAIKGAIEKSWEYIVSKRKIVYIGLILTAILPPIIKYTT